MTWLAQARNRNQSIGQIPYDGGTQNPQTFVMPQIGYLNEIRTTEQLAGQFGTASPTGPDGVAALSGGLARISLTVNSIAPLFDTDGAMAAVIAAINENYNCGGAGEGVQTILLPSGAANFNPAPAQAAFTDNWYHAIPLGLNLRNLPYPIGLFQTALQNLSMRLTVRWLPLKATSGAPGTGLYVAPTSTIVTPLNGQSAFVENYFDPIADPASQPPLGYIHRWTQFQQPLTAAGDLQILLPGQNYYTRIIYMVVTGAVNTLALDGTSLQRLRLMYGSNFAPYDEDQTKLQVTDRMRQLYGDRFMATLPAGFYTHDFIHKTHDSRDWINASATTNLRSVLTFSNSGNYTGGAYVNVAVEEIAPLTLPGGVGQSVQGGNPLAA